MSQNANPHEPALISVPRTITDAAEAQRLHAELSKLTASLAELEEEWLKLVRNVEPSDVKFSIASKNGSPNLAIPILKCRNYGDAFALRPGAATIGH